LTAFRDALKDLDKDEDGKINVNEMTELLEKLQLHDSQKIAKQLIEEAALRGKLFAILFISNLKNVF
jgi:Ca2+-binding EF-hand superfamily protein